MQVQAHYRNTPVTSLATAPGREREALLELPSVYRSLYIAVIAFYTLFVAWASAEQTVAATLCNMLWILTISYPIVFYKKGWGIENPLVLMCLFSTISLVFRQTGGLVYGLPYHTGLPNHSPGDLNNLYCYGRLLGVLSTLMIYVGFLTSTSLRVPRIVTQPLPKKKILWLIGMMLAVSLGSFAVMIVVSGDFTSHLGNVLRGAGGRKFAKDVGSLGPLALLVNFAGTAGILALTSRQNRLLTLAICLVALAMAYLVEGRRGAVVITMILFLLAWALTHRRVPLLSTLIALVLALGVIAAGSLMRESNFSTGRHIDFKSVINMSPSQAFDRASRELSSRSNTASPIYAIIARVPEDVDHLYGTGYLRYFNLFIPRYFWRDKPRGIDFETGIVFFGVPWGMPPGPLGQAYWEFNIPGVIVIFFLFGVAKRVLYECLVRSPISFATIALYLVATFYMAPDQNSFRQMVFVFLPLLLFLRFTGAVRMRFA